MRIVSCVFLVLLLWSCSDERASVGTLRAEGLDIRINSAGIGYDVVDESRLDSSKGLNYIIELSVTNKRDKSVQLADSTFTLIDPSGTAVREGFDPHSVEGAINLNTTHTSISPGATEEVMLYYRVREHGVYRLQYVSPVRGKKYMATLPES